MTAGRRPEADELDGLLTALIDAELDEGQRAQLNELLAADSAARRRYVDAVTVHAMLQWRHGVRMIELPLESASELSSRPRTTPMFWTIAALAAAILLTTATWIYHRDRQRAAWLTADEGVVWGDAGAENRGQVLRRGRRQLQAGTAHMRLGNGVVLAIVGPADFEIQQATRLELHAGRLRCYAPPGVERFTVLAAGIEVVDLGTEFAVAVDQNRELEIHVFDGRIEVNRQFELYAGDRRRIDRSRKMVDPKLTARMFPTLLKNSP